MIWRKNRFLKRKRYIFSKNKMTYVFFISLGPLFVESSNSSSCCLGSLNFYNLKTQQQTNNKLLELENSGYVWTYLVNVYNDNICYQSMFQIYSISISVKYRFGEPPKILKKNHGRVFVNFYMAPYVTVLKHVFCGETKKNNNEIIWI